MFSEVPTEPKDFKVTQAMVDTGRPRGDRIYPAASKILFDTVAVTNRGTNIPAPLLHRPLGGVMIGGIPINFSSLAVIVVFGGSLWINRAHPRQRQGGAGSDGHPPGDMVEIHRRHRGADHGAADCLGPAFRNSGLPGQ